LSAHRSALSAEQRYFKFMKNNKNQ